MTERRSERRVDDRLGSLEHQVEAFAPSAVHLAEIRVQTAAMAAQLDRIENKRLDPIHLRLRRVEYAVIALIVAYGSPKVGGPSIPQVASSVTSFFS